MAKARGLKKGVTLTRFLTAFVFDGALYVQAECSDGQLRHVLVNDLDDCDLSECNCESRENASTYSELTEELARRGVEDNQRDMTIAAGLLMERGE